MLHPLKHCITSTAMALMAGCGLWNAAHAENNSASAGDSFQLARVNALLANDKARYALVTRPSDMAGHRVDLVELEPSTRRPVSRLPTSLSCDRLHASSKGSLLCFSRVTPGASAKGGFPRSHFLSRTLQLLKSHPPHEGSISRARSSADGKYIATTAFVSGHGYASGPGQFSTATYLGGGSESRPEENIQRWKIFRNGTPFQPPDINLWGVTFDPSNSRRFFVTVYSGGVAYLAQGDVALRKIDVGTIQAECPSFSPSGKYLAYKKKVTPVRWAPAILELATGKQRVFDMLPDSVDDQIEWLGENELIYEVAKVPLLGRPRIDLMSLDIRSSASPRQQLWLSDARSPTFVGER